MIYIKTTYMFSCFISSCFFYSSCSLRPFFQSPLSSSPVLFSISPRPTALALTGSHLLRSNNQQENINLLAIMVNLTTPGTPSVLPTRRRNSPRPSSFNSSNASINSRTLSGTQGAVDHSEQEHKCGEDQAQEEALKTEPVSAEEAELMLSLIHI